MRRAPFIHIVLLIAFLATSIGPLPLYAQEFSLPKPGVMVHLSPSFNPPVLKGVKIHLDNPFKFDFILDQGDNVIPAQAGIQQQEQLKAETQKLVKYFLASVTVPDKDLWVNLSPYEKDRIIPDAFGKTEMGRDLLAQDYMLKQVTASLIYPEDEVGKKFWSRIYAEAQKKYGTTQVPVNTFNKVWIVPEKAVVYENAKEGVAYVIESKLKVMLEQDYLSLEKNISTVIPAHSTGGRIPEGQEGIQDNSDVSAIGSAIVREIVIPELTKEINEGKNFSQLRQVYQSLILATWYKRKIKESILAQAYTDKAKVQGLSSPNALIGDPGKGDIEGIYQQYIQAFKKGAFNYIKEEADTTTQQQTPRKYFSGGAQMSIPSAAMAYVSTMPDSAQLISDKVMRASINLVTKEESDSQGAGLNELMSGNLKAQDKAMNVIYEKDELFFLSQTKDLLRFYRDKYLSTAVGFQRLSDIYNGPIDNIQVAQTVFNAVLDAIVAKRLYSEYPQVSHYNISRIYTWLLERNYLLAKTLEKRYSQKSSETGASIWIVDRYEFWALASIFEAFGIQLNGNSINFLPLIGTNHAFQDPSLFERFKQLSERYSRRYLFRHVFLILSSVFIANKLTKEKEVDVYYYIEHMMEFLEHDFNIVDSYNLSLPPLMEAGIESNIYISDSTHRVLYDAIIRFDRKWGEDFEDIDQIRAINKAIQRKEIGGIYLDIRGLINKNFWKELLDLKVSELGVIYSLSLPSGRIFRFILKDGKINWEPSLNGAYTEKDKIIIRGCIKSIENGRIMAILTGGDAINGKEAIDNYLFEEFSKEEASKSKVDVDNFLSSLGDVNLRERVLAAFSRFQDDLKDGSVGKKWRIQDGSLKERIVVRILQNLEWLRSHQIGRDLSDEDAILRSNLFFGSRNGYKITLENIFTDAISQVVSRESQALPGGYNIFPNKDLSEVGDLLSIQNRITIKAVIEDKRDGRSEVKFLSEDQLVLETIRVLEENITRAQVNYNGNLRIEIDKQEELIADLKRNYEENKRKGTADRQGFLRKLRDYKERLLALYESTSSPEFWSNNMVNIVYDSPKRKFLYVVNDNGRISISDQVINLQGKEVRVSHADISNGLNVFGAGELIFSRIDSQWVLTEINNKSGHFRPSAWATLNYVAAIIKNKYKVKEWSITKKAVSADLVDRLAPSTRVMRSPDKLARYIFGSPNNAMSSDLNDRGLVSSAMTSDNEDIEKLASKITQWHKDTGAYSPESREEYTNKIRDRLLEIKDRYPTPLVDPQLKMLRAIFGEKEQKSNFELFMDFINPKIIVHERDLALDEISVATCFFNIAVLGGVVVQGTNTRNVGVALKILSDILQTEEGQDPIFRSIFLNRIYLENRLNKLVITGNNKDGFFFEGSGVREFMHTGSLLSAVRAIYRDIQTYAKNESKDDSAFKSALLTAFVRYIARNVFANKIFSRVSHYMLHIQENSPGVIISNTNRPIRELLDPYMPSEGLVNVLRVQEDSLPQEFHPLLNMVVDYKEWARSILQSAKALSFLTFLKENDFASLDKMKKFSLFYYASGETKRREVLERIFSLLNENQLSKEWVLYFDENYEKLISGLSRKSFELTNKGLIAQLYESRARKFQEHAFLLKKSRSKNDKGYLTHQLFEEKLRLHNISGIFLNSDFNEVFAYWNRQYSSGVKLISDNELASLKWILANLPESEYGSDRISFIHFFVLSLVERRIQNKRSPVAVLMGRAISSIKKEAADSADIITNFIYFAWVYTRMSRGLQENHNEILKEIIDRQLEASGDLGAPQYNALKTSVIGALNPKIRNIEFKDGGNANTDFPEFLNGLLGEISFPVPERPLGMPQREPGFVKSVAISPQILSALKRAGEESLWFGRTMVVPIEADKKAIHIKFLRQGEDISLLGYEYDMMNFFNERKTEWDLIGAYPRGVARLIRINAQQNPGILPSRATQKGPLMLAQEDGDYLAIVYETDLDAQGRNAYTTYLNDPDLSHDEFEKAFKVNIHDLMKLASHGIFNLELIELFHNQEHGRSRQYDWMVDVKHFQETRRVAGRINDIPGSTFYPNMRLSGLSDFAGFRSLGDILEDKEVRNKADNRVGRLLNMVNDDPLKAAPYLITALLGDTILSLSLLPVTYLQNRDYAFHNGNATELVYDGASNQDDFFYRMLSILFAESAVEYAENPDVIAVAPDYKLMARQFTYFMNREYVIKQIPLGFYPGAEITQVAQGRGWTEKGWDIRNAKYLIPSRNSNLNFTVSSFDLGPVNGPNPVQELIRGLYLVIPQMVVGRLTSSTSSAMVVSNKVMKAPGGIDLTTDKVPLEVKSGSPTTTYGDDKAGIKFNIDPAMIEQLKNAQGFVPVIINLEPIKDLRGFLGLNQSSTTVAAGV